MFCLFTSPASGMLERREISVLASEVQSVVDWSSSDEYDGPVCNLGLRWPGQCVYVEGTCGEVTATLEACLRAEQARPVKCEETQK